MKATDFFFFFSEPPKLVVNEKRYGRRSRPDASYSEDLYSADDESMMESQPESRLSDSRLTSEVDHQEVPTREVRTLKTNDPLWRNFLIVFFCETLRVWQPVSIAIILEALKFTGNVSYKASKHS